MNQLSFPEKDIKSIIDRITKILGNFSRKQDIPEEESLIIFFSKEEPWRDDTTGELIVIEGGLLSIDNDPYIDLKVKVVGDQLCFKVKSDGKIDEQIFCEETLPGHVSDEDLINLLENFYGFGQASD